MMIALFCAILMVMLIPMNVVALDITSTYGFEGLVAPGQMTNAPTSPANILLTSTKRLGNFNASATTVRTGSRSFVIDGGSATTSSGWFNLSYSQSNYLTYFQSYSYLVNPGANKVIEIGFYNKTLGQSTINFATYPRTSYTRYMVIVVFDWASSKYGYVDSVGVLHYNTNLAITSFKNFNFTLLNNIGDVSYGYSTGTTNGVACNSTAINENYRIDSMFFFDTYAGGGWTGYFDDMTFTLSDSYSAGVSGCSDFTGSTPTGRFAYGSTDVDSSHISMRYNVPVTTTVTGVELQILQTQYDSDSDTAHYGCSINGVNIGFPVCIFSESYYYVIQWTCNFTVTASTINFDFYHSQLISGTQYWEVGCGVSTSDDVNGDGEVEFVFTDTSVVYHWEWYYWVYMFRPTYGAGDTVFPRDLGMRFWSTGFTATETFDYDDHLGLSSYSSSNSTGYIYDLSGGYDNIMGSYTLGNSGATYTLNLYVNGTLSYDYGFPIHCRYPGDGFGFSPNTIGKYRLQLNSTHAVANVTAWVIGARSGYSIRTNPVISNQFMSYSVIASYNNPQGYAGGIAMDNYVETLNAFLRCVYQRHPVTNNQTTTFSYQSNGTLPEYWGLYVYANNLYTKVDDCKHYIRLPSVYTNDIHTPLNNYPVSTIGVSSLGVTLTGTHMFPGADVRIYANSIYVMNVGDSQYFTETFYPRAFGYYNVTMLLYQNGTFTYLANCNFTVSSTDSPGVEDPNQQYADLIPEEYRLFVAIGIILGFMFMPMAFIYSMNKTMQRFNVTINVPAMVIIIMSVMTGIVGYTLTIMWGLLEWWTVFLLIFVLALVVLILYLKGGKSE
jgi:hypothetical protein